MTSDMVTSSEEAAPACNHTQPVPEVTVQEDGGVPPVTLEAEKLEVPPVKEVPKRRPPLQRGISRNKSDPKLLPVINIAFVLIEFKQNSSSNLLNICCTNFFF